MKEKIISCLLVIPMATHWLLPDGIEKMLYLNLLFPFYLPNIFYFIYMAKYSYLRSITCDISDGAIKSNVIRNTKLLMTLVFFVGFIITMLQGCNNIIALMFDNQWFVFMALLFILYPMNSKMLDNTKYVLIPTAVILCLEVILYSLGILSYTVDLGNTDYEGVLRISTTVGAATGTGVIIVLLGVVISSSYKLAKYSELTLIALTTVSVFYTISRGSIVVWTAYLAYYSYMRFLKGTRISTKILTILTASLAIVVLNNYNVFEPVLSRQKQLKSDGMVMTNRDVLQEEAINLYRQSGYMGVGVGQTNAEKSLLSVCEQSHHVGVHNFYIMTLAEVGFIGLGLYVLFLLILVFNFDYSKVISFYALSMVTLVFSSEPIYCYEEFLAPSFFVIMIALKRYN